MKKSYYITLAREHDSNTTTYVYFGCYGKLEEFRKHLTAITQALMAGGNVIESIKPYMRPDGVESWYIHVK